MKMDQDQVFSKDEGDHWFERNAAALEAKARSDVALRMLSLLDPAYSGEIRSICDVGCANGWRLPGLAAALPNVTRLCGFDASAAAVAAGRARAADLDLRQGLIDAPPFNESFDLVIASFVLHWIDRDRLMTSLARIDGLVRPGGALIVMDFLPDAPCARRYHHRSDIELFTFKQDYPACFTASGRYRELARITFNHDSPIPGAVAPAPSQERAVCTWLHKAGDGQPIL